MNKLNKKMRGTLIALALLICCASTFALLALFPKAGVTLSGFQMQKDANGKIQANVTISLENVECTGLVFELLYDNTLLKASDTVTNELASAQASYFKPNELLFTDKSFYPSSGVYATDRKIDDTTNAIGIFLVPDNASDNTEDGDGMETGVLDGSTETYKYINANTEEKTDIGVVSFQVLDVQRFAELSAQAGAIDSLFRLNVQTESGETKEQLFISYMDENGDQKEYSGSAYIKYELTSAPVLVAATANGNAQTVFSCGIYGAGTQEDAIAYINNSANAISEEYSDGTVETRQIVWGGESFSMTPQWDPKGGVYTVNQDYLTFPVEMVLTVNPTTISGFTFDDEALCYPPGTQPTDMALLELPSTVKPILSQTIADLELDEIRINPYLWACAPSFEQSFVLGTLGTYEFTAEVPIDALAAKYPWLDTAETPSVMVERYIGEPTGDPEGIVATVDGASGVMTITVDNIGGEAIPDGTVFSIKLPNNITLNQAQFANGIPVAITDGKAVITIATDDLTNPYQLNAQQYINLGGQANEFKLAAKVTGSGLSKYVGFSSAARQNAYITKSGEEQYIFDYSGANKQLFEFDIGAVLSETIMLAGTDTVHTRYHGKTGDTPGELSIITVESWALISGDPDQANSVVTYRGILSEAFYQGFGRVEKHEDIPVTLTLETSDTPAELPQGNIIEDFTFDTRKVGYDKETLQIAELVIENSGCNLSGLNVSLGEEHFEVVTQLPRTLPSKQSAPFSIRPTVGLAPGTYTDTVRVRSNQSSNFVSFKVSFKVVSESTELYEVKTSVNDADFGKAEVVGSKIYEVGETVTVKATPKNNEFNFDIWRSVTPENLDITPLVAGAPQLSTFIMPAEDTEVQAEFKETTLAKLNLENLIVQCQDGRNNSMMDKDNNVIIFDAYTNEYYVFLPHDAGQAKIYIKPKNTSVAIDKDIALSVTHDGGEAVTIPNVADADGSYTTSTFNVSTIPDVDILTVTQKYGADAEQIEKSYVVHVSKKMPTATLIASGNSPYGLIEAMSAWDAQKKETAKSEFDKANRFAPNLVPNGGNSLIRYTTAAWETDAADDPYVNYDKDETALFAYTNSAFKDPGFSGVINSLGSAVADADVTRKLKVDIMRDDTDDTIENDMLDANVTTKEITVTGKLNDYTFTELENLRVRPGIYTIVYEYDDFDLSKLSFERKLIILPKNGDVNIDSQVAKTDAELIYNHITQPLPYENSLIKESARRLYRYRACDANYDKNVNAIDANTLLSEAVKLFYPEYPLQAPIEEVPVESLAPATIIPKLSVAYLGATADGSPDIDEEALPQLPIFTSADNGKVFWIGIGIDNLKDFSLATDGLYSLELGVDYDPAYVVPANKNGDVAEETWLDTVIQNNFSAQAEATDTWKWDSDLYELITSACSINAAPDVNLLRENAADAGRKMAFISLKRKDNMGGAQANRFYGDTSTEKKYIAVLPFKITGVPLAGTQIIPIKLALGPSTAVIGAKQKGVEAYGAWEKNDQTESGNNLKNLLNFAGDLDLFQTGEPTETATVRDISLLKIGTDNSETEQAIFWEEQQMNSGFASNVHTYYAVLPNDVENIKLSIDTDAEKIAVAHSDMQTPPTETVIQAEVVEGDIWKTVSIPITVSDPAIANGFSNDVRVTVGANTYVIKIKRRGTLNDNARLSGLVLTGTSASTVDTEAVELTPIFEAGTIVYEAGIPKNSDTLVVTPTLEDLGASITGVSLLHPSALTEPTKISLISDGAGGYEVAVADIQAGDWIEVETTAADGATQIVYTVALNGAQGKIVGQVRTVNSRGNHVTGVYIYKSGAVTKGQWQAVGVDNYHLKLQAAKDAFVKKADTNADGTFSIDIAPGTYDIVLDRAGYLDYIIVSVQVEQEKTTKIAQETIGLVQGDINKSGKVDISDKNALNACFNKTAGYDANTDKANYNGDGKVDVSDVNSLNAAFNKMKTNCFKEWNGILE